MPTATVDPETGVFWACWYDTTFDPHAHRAWFTCSASHTGRTWSPPERASSVPTAPGDLLADAIRNGFYPAIAAAHGTAHPLWIDGRRPELAEELYTALRPRRRPRAVRGPGRRRGRVEATNFAHIACRSPMKGLPMNARTHRSSRPCQTRLAHPFPRCAASSRSRGSCARRRTCPSSSTRPPGRSPSRSDTARSRSASTGPPGTTSPSRPSTAATPHERCSSGRSGPSPTGRCSSTTASSATAPTSSPPARSTGTRSGRAMSPTAPSGQHPTPGTRRTGCSCRCATRTGICSASSRWTSPRTAGARPRASSTCSSRSATMPLSPSQAAQEAAEANRHRRALEALLSVSSGLSGTHSAGTILERVCVGHPQRPGLRERLYRPRRPGHGRARAACRRRLAARRQEHRRTALRDRPRAAPRPGLRGRRLLSAP